LPDIIEGLVGESGLAKRQGWRAKLFGAYPLSEREEAKPAWALDLARCEDRTLKLLFLSHSADSSFQD
jgi:hypothetical protein